MKKLLTILFILIAYISQAQYTPMNAYGYMYKRVMADSTLHIPSFCGVPTLRSSATKKSAIAIDTCNHSLYFYDAKTLTWSVVSGGGCDTCVVRDFAYDSLTVKSILQNGDTIPAFVLVLDSAWYNYIQQYVLLLGDTAAMLDPYKFHQLVTYQMALINQGITPLSQYNQIDAGGFEQDRRNSPLWYDEAMNADSSKAIMALNASNADSPLVRLQAQNIVGSVTSKIEINKHWPQITKNGGTGKNIITSINGTNLADTSGNVTFTVGGVDSAANGLTDSARRIILGGTLYKSTVINTGTRSFDITGSGNISLFTQNGSRQAFIGTSSSDVTLAASGATAGADQYQLSVNGATDGTGAVYAMVQSLSGLNISTNTFRIKKSFNAVGTGTTLTSGSGVNFTMESNTNTSNSVKPNNISNTFHSVWTDPVTGTRTSKFSITGVNSTVTNELLALSGNGGAQLTQYTPASIFYKNDSTTYKPVTMDATGNVFRGSWPSGGGITSLNGETGATQTFAISTTGTDFTISSGSNVHTFNLPTASASNRGALSSTDWSMFNGKGRVDSIRLVNTGILHTSPATFSLSGSTGVVTQTLATQTANTVFAGATSGGAATPTFRSLVAADIPSLSGTYLLKAGDAYTTTTGTGLDINSSTLTTGSLVGITLTGTAATSNTKNGLAITSSGANGTSSQTVTGQTIGVTNTGTTNTNVGLNVTASGATNNYAAVFTGRVGIGTTAPNSLLELVDNAVSVAMRFRDAGISTPFTTNFPTGTIASIGQYSNNSGGLYIEGMGNTANQPGVAIVGDIGNATPTTAGVVIFGNKLSGTSITDMTGTNKILSIGNPAIATFQADGDIGFGVTSSTAVLNLKAGTATASTAPLKFTTGINLTTPEAGVMEFDGTDFFLTPAAARQKIAYRDLAQTFSNTQTFSGTLIANVIQTTAVTNASNLFVPTSVGVGSSVSSAGYITNANNIQFRVGVKGNTATVATAGTDVFALAIGDNTFTEATSGTSALAGGLYIKTQTFTDGAGATTDFQNAYFGDAPTGATYNHSINAGNSKFRGTLGVGVTTTVDASAQLDIVSTTKGILIPRMTTTQMNAISSPATGLKLYNTDAGTEYAYNGTAYKSVGTISGSISTVLTAATTITVTFGGTQPNATYKINITPTGSILSVGGYVNNKTTTTFDYVLPITTGTVTFDYTLTQ